MDDGKDEEKRGRVEGMARGLWELLKLLAETEGGADGSRSVSGEADGPFGSKTTYGLKVRTLDSLASSRAEGGRRTWAPAVRRARTPEVVAPDDEGHEPLVDVFDEGECIAIVAQLPQVREEDVQLELVGSALRITVDTPSGPVERNISVPEGSEVERIEAASFNNGIMEIRLIKKKEPKEDGSE